MRHPFTVRLRVRSLTIPVSLLPPPQGNLLEWHFTIRGPPDTEFEGGVYHGRIVLPPEYPFKPPNIMLLTPNGRFEIRKMICLSISAFHPETWQPAWGSTCASACVAPVGVAVFVLCVSVRVCVFVLVSLCVYERDSVSVCLCW